MSIMIYPLGSNIRMDNAHSDGHCVHTWNIDTQTVNLLQIGDQLAYQVVDQGGHWSVEIERGNQTIEEQLAKLKAAEVVLNFDGSVDFLKPELRCPTTDNREITLLASRNDLIWQLFDKATKQSSQILCYFKNELPLQERVRIIHNNTINQFAALGNQLRSVSLQPIIEPSLLDPEQFVNGDVWAVTLISCGQSDGSDPCSWGGHAAILIEGIEKRKETHHKHFLIKSHLTADETNIGSISLYWLDYFRKGADLWFQFKGENKQGEIQLFNKKSTTWIKPRTQVLLMLDAITQEVHNQHPYAFDFRGGGAAGVSDKFYINNVGFAKETADEKMEKIGAAPLRVVQFISDRFPLIGNRWRKNIWPSLFGSKKDRTRFAHLLEDQNSSSEAFAKKYFSLMVTHGVNNVSIVKAENCLTWAQKKLQILNIEIVENPFVKAVNGMVGRAISLPIAFTKNHKV